MGMCVRLGGPPALPTPTACLRGNETDGGLQYLPTPTVRGKMFWRRLGSQTEKVGEGVNVERGGRGVKTEGRGVGEEDKWR